jgi:hypothetical protein
MARRRINGDGTYWFAETENRWRAQYFDFDDRRRNLSQVPQAGWTETVDASEIDLPTIWAKVEELSKVKK